MLGTFIKGFLISFIIEVTQTYIPSFSTNKKRTPQPRDSQAVSRKNTAILESVHRNRILTDRWRIKTYRKFAHLSKKHYYLRTFCACQGFPYMLHCTGKIVLQGGWPLVSKGWRWCWWTTIILTSKILWLLACSF